MTPTQPGAQPGAGGSGAKASPESGLTVTESNVINVWRKQDQVFSCSNKECSEEMCGLKDCFMFVLLDMNVTPDKLVDPRFG